MFEVVSNFIFCYCRITLNISVHNIFPHIRLFSQRFPEVKSLGQRLYRVLGLFFCFVLGFFFFNIFLPFNLGIKSHIFELLSKRVGSYNTPPPKQRKFPLG